MASTPFKGALKTKRKNELAEIATALGVDSPSKRDDLEAVIKDHLVANRSKLEPKAQYEGLYSSLDRGEKTKARVSTGGDSESDNGSPATRTPKKHTQRTKPNGVLGNVSAEADKVATEASSIVSSMAAVPKRSLDNLASAFRSSASSARGEAREVAADASHAGKRFTRKIKSMTKKFDKHVAKAYHRAQDVASDSGNLIRLTIALEAIVLVLSVLPTHYFNIGESKLTQLKHGRIHSSIPHWAITIPDVRGLLTLGFWLPILLWTLYTVALPALASYLITFQRKHEPSAVTFTYTRLALLVLVSHYSSSAAALPFTLGVAAGQPKVGLEASLSSYWSYALVPLDHGVQIVGTALLAGLASYEVIATRR